MAAITGCTQTQEIPNASYAMVVLKTPATADSNDTIDASSATVTGGLKFSKVFGCVAFDSTTGDNVTCTISSSTTLTLDAAGGTTDHTYYITLWGLL